MGINGWVHDKWGLQKIGSADHFIDFGLVGMSDA